VKGILADTNIEGYVDFLVSIVQAEPWKLFWEDLGVSYLHFAQIGLPPGAPDSLVWETSQNQELVLITDNRNQDAADSLEATIKARNTPTSLPVLTIGSIQQLRHSRDYTNRVIERLLDTLQRIEMLRGTGRLYLP
jgi:hypothetical protein